MVIADKNNYNNKIYSHKGENCHTKYTEEKYDGLDIEHFKPELKTKMKKEIRKHKEEQQILLKENKQNIVDFIIDNKDSIRI
jgi:hypothetical protein